MAPKAFTGLRPLVPSVLGAVPPAVVSTTRILVDKVKPALLDIVISDECLTSVAVLWPILHPLIWRMLAAVILPRSLPNIQALAERFDAVARVIAVSLWLPCACLVCS